MCRTWYDGPLHVQDVIFIVDAPDFEAELLAPFAAHVSGHFHAFDWFSILSEKL